jgi:nucleoside-diphosphate-sugar epimerase
MNIIVTGGNGFLGRNLLPKLINEKHNILQITTDPERAEKLFGGSVKIYQFQKDDDNLKNVLKDFQPETVIHLASYLTANDDKATMLKLMDAGIMFLNYLLDALKESGLKWFINTGSFAEYYKGDGVPDPAYLYTAAKIASRVFVDYYSKAYNFNYLTIVPYTIYGSIDSQKKIIDIIYDSLSCDERVDLTPGNQVLDFIHLDDVTDFYMTCLSELDKIPGKSNFQLGTGTGHTLRDIAALMEKHTGRKANINWGGKTYRPRDVMYAVANTSLQHHLFNWKPKISLEDGILNYINNKALYEVKA